MLWEIFGYEPKAVFILEIVDTMTQTKIFGDLSHVYYFLESYYYCTSVRGLGTSEVKYLF